MLSRKRAGRIALADQRRCAGVVDTLPRGRAIGSARAALRHAVAKVATFSGAAVRVLIALRSGLAEKSVADRARGAVGVDGALPEVHTSIAHAGKAHWAIRVHGALHFGLAGARNRLAFLTHRTVRVLGAAAGDDAEVILTCLSRIAVRVGAALAGKDALAAETFFVRCAVCIGITADRWHALSHFALELGWTIDVAQARALLDALSVLTGESRRAHDLVA